ncbi:type IV secretion system protein, partial [Escherichia coli]
LSAEAPRQRVLSSIFSGTALAPPAKPKPHETNSHAAVSGRRLTILKREENSMKKTLTALFLGATLTGYSSVASSVGGVIVKDPGSIAKTVEVIKKAADQIAELKKQVDLATSQLEAYKQEVLDTKRRLEGITDYSAIFGSAESYMKDFWEDMKKELTDADIRSMATKYGFDTKEYDRIKRQYESKFEEITKYEAMSKDLEKSAEKIKATQKAFSKADTPQKREELQNNILLETAAMQLKIAQNEAEINRMARERKLREEAALIKYTEDNFSFN